MSHDNHSAQPTRAYLGVRVPADRRRDAGYWVYGRDRNGDSFTVLAIGSWGNARRVVRRIRGGMLPFEAMQDD